MSPPAALDARAAAMRAEFDRAFAAARPEGGAAAVPLLGVGIRGDPYLLPLSGLRGLSGDWRAAPLPGSPPGLLGLAGIQGELVPVYDLGSVLGYSGGEGCRWLARLAGGQPLAVAFAGCSGVRHVPASDLAAAAGGGPVRHLPGHPPLIDVPALVAAINLRARGPR